MIPVFLPLTKVTQVFQKKRKRVVKTLSIEEVNEEETYANEEEATRTKRNKHKVTPNPKQTTPSAIFESPTPSTQHINLVSHSFYADSNTDTLNRNFEATLAKHFASFKYKHTLSPSQD